jgi:hypothetical protein
MHNVEILPFSNAINMLLVQMDKQLRSIRVQCPKIGGIPNGTSDPQKTSTWGMIPALQFNLLHRPVLEVKPLALTRESHKQMGHFLL